jgi:hypothetical protein
MSAEDRYRLRLIALLIAATMGGCASLKDQKRVPMRHRAAPVIVEGVPKDVQFAPCVVLIEGDRARLVPDPDSSVLLDPSLPVICK